MRLYRFPYSCYARKVQTVLDLLGLRYATVDVPFGDRTELASVTGGYIQVPVLVDAAGTVTVDSRAICERLLHGEAAARLVPSPWEGPIWAYADWCDGPLEDVMFRIAAPRIARSFVRPADSALFIFIKERKFGRGCVAEWERGASELISRARDLLVPTTQTLARQPFIFGKHPTLADAALYGQCAMLSIDAAMPAALAPALGDWMNRVDAAARR